MTRVLYVDHVARLSGGERSLLDLVRALDRTRYAPALACPGEGPLPDAFRALGLPVFPLIASDELLAVSRGALDTSIAGALRWIPGTMRLAGDVARAARESGARLIVSNSLKAHVIASAAAWMTGLPLVWHMRDCLSPGRVGRAMGWLARASARRVIAISDAVVQSLASAGFSMSSVVRVYNGLELGHAVGRPVLRHELDLPDDAFVVGTVGQLSRWKGLHVLLEAARALPNVRVVLTGACLFEGNEADYLRELQAQAAGLDGRVTFLGAREDIPDVMASLDAFVHPVVEPEPFGRVLVEAMAAGRPVIASDAGAAREVLGDAGVLVPPGDVAALTAALSALAADPARRAALARAGQERAAREFTIQTCRARVEAVYAEVLSR